MSDTQTTATETAATSDNCNCCAQTDGRNVVNVCAPGNTLYIGCLPPCECSGEGAAADATDSTAVA